jgi:hypothetical protein
LLSNMSIRRPRITRNCDTRNCRNNLAPRVLILAGISIIQSNVDVDRGIPHNAYMQSSKHHIFKSEHKWHACMTRLFSIIFIFVSAWLETEARLT